MDDLSRLFVVLVVAIIATLGYASHLDSLYTTQSHCLTPLPSIYVRSICHDIIDPLGVMAPSLESLETGEMYDNQSIAQVIEMVERGGWPYLQELRK